MSTKIKYPRIPHLPWSAGVGSDDKIISDLSVLETAAAVVVTEKMDGENTTIYSDGTCHARSLDSKSHPSRDWIKKMAASWSGFPASMRICGENLYAKHSIAYEKLESYFYVFAIYDNGQVLSWKQTMQVCDTLSLVHVPMLYVGTFDRKLIEARFKDYCFGKDDVEGYVVRTVGGFNASEFDTHVAKYVRAGHVQTDAHWMNKPVVKNKLINIK